MRKQEFFLKRLIYSKIFFIVGLIILFFLSLTLGKRFLEQREIKQEIKNLEKNAETLEKRNDELTKLIEYLNTSLYIEEAARTKLGLQKPGESVIVVPKEMLLQEKKEKNVTVNELPSREKSNAEKWWDYFFKK